MVSPGSLSPLHGSPPHTASSGRCALPADTGTAPTHTHTHTHTHEKGISEDSLNSPLAYNTNDKIRLAFEITAGHGLHLPG